MEPGKKEAQRGCNAKFPRRPAGSITQGALGTAHVSLQSCPDQEARS